MKNKFVKLFYCFNEGEGDGTGGAGNSSSSSVVDSGSSPSPVDSFLSTVPEQYHNESFIDELKSAEDPQQALWSKFAGMHSALQKQPGGMPALDAPVEEWQKWTSTVAPKDAGVYGDIKPQVNFEEKPHLKELLDPVYAPEILTTVLDTARTLGVQPYQMKGLMETFNKLQVEAAEHYHNSTQEAKQVYDKQFDDFCTKQFGKDRDKIVGEGFEFIAKNVPSDLVEHVNNLPNEALATVAALAYNLKKQYGKEDTVPGVTGGVHMGGNDIPSIKSKIAEIMNGEAWKSMGRHGGYQQAVNEVKQLSEQLARLTRPTKGY